MPFDDVLQRRLEVLRDRVAKLISSSRLNVLVDPRDATPLFERWITLYSDLCRADEEFISVPRAVLPALFAGNINVHEGRGGYDLRTLIRTFEDMEEAWTIATHPSKQSAPVTLGREGIFLAGQPFDAMLAVSSIVRDAKQSIVLIDGYIGEKTLQLISSKASMVSVEILTNPQKSGAQLHPSTLVLAQAFVQQFGKTLEIRTRSTFHDRFLFVDGAELYHFGASIKDAAKSTFMFSRIDEPAVIQTLQAAYARDWAAAQVVPL